MDAKNISRIALGAMLIGAGIGHLTFARKEFRAQVPDVIPIKKDDTIAYSGIVEIALGASIIASPSRYRNILGKITASFFIAVFPGNISQYQNRRDAFQLDTDNKRLARLFIQPLLIIWALKSMCK
ncbi:DoxX family protein [Chryseobacterium chendengshani]|uniref:DoxX family protein n=1 Tax=Chryseobacterium sp. LJ756 TaxID=2864113 RepID=UPI001C642B1F|nr:hypothetical protein [Chryseobacterium sp. LJ756]MBW7674344.1 hypothetical protein [Chryseobacterium sp. LJ756]